jgi:hypothetical protein
MKSRIAWLYISSFVALLVWVLYEEIRDAIAEGRLMQTLVWGVIVLVSMIVVGVVTLGITALAEWGIEKLRLQVRKRQYCLPEGVTMEMVLRESPYELLRGGWGEADYVIDRQTGELVDWEDPEGAEGWIIRQYLQQRRNERQNKTSGIGRA